MRLFVAAELPGPVVDALVGWRPALPGLRPVAPAALHLTLAFLGERSEEEAAAAAAVVRAVAVPVGGLSLGASLWLPSRRPRVLAVSVCDAEDGRLGALQAAVAAGLEEAIGFSAERRRFLAHVTVGRLRSPVRAAARDLSPVPTADFALCALTLMRSRLGGGPGGTSLYEPRERVVLSPFLR